MHYIPELHTYTEVRSSWETNIRQIGIALTFAQYAASHQKETPVAMVIGFIAAVWDVPTQHITLIRTQGVYRVRGLDKVYPLHMVLREHLGN